MRYVVVGGLATAEVGEELLLCDASGTVVHRISGDARRYLERVARGDGELPDDQVTAALVAANVVLPVGVDIAPVETGVSRRQAIAMGAAATAAVGVVTVGLPSAAAAQSPGPEPEPSPSYPAAPPAGTGAAGATAARRVAESEREGTDYFALALWTTSTLSGQNPVDFNWKLYSPGNIGVPSNLVTSGGPSLGSTGPVPIPNGAPLQSFIFMLTAADGTNIYITGTLPS